MGDEKVGKMPAMETTLAIADVPAEQLEYLCDGHGCGVSHAVQHGGGKSNLLTHLTEVRYVLKKQLLCDDEALLAAALFHSIYGTEGFQGKVLPLSERPKVRAVIGERAEFTAYLNCVMHRATLDEAVCRLQEELSAAGTDNLGSESEGYFIFSRTEHGRERIPLTREQLIDLMTVHFADWAQQVARYSMWSYRREAYQKIAETLGGIYAATHKEIIATEPADAENRLPEMVRARQLGIFDEVMRGEVKLQDFLDKNNKIATA